MLLMGCVPFETMAVDNYLRTDSILPFNNTDYALGWSSHPTDFQYLQEYFPEGQNPDKFTDMLSVWLVVSDLSAKQWMESMVVQYTNQKKTDPVCNFQTYETKGEYIMDGLLGKSENGLMKAIEFNVYRCKNIKVDGKKALLICFYSGHAYDDDIMPFLTELKDRRKELVTAMIKFQYPEISIE